MHTSVRLPEELGHRVRAVCQERNISLTVFIQNAARNELLRKEIADLEKRLSASHGNLEKKMNRLTVESRAGFALFLTLTQELLGHIYPDPQIAQAQVKALVRSAQQLYEQEVRQFFGEAHGH